MPIIPTCIFRSSLILIMLFLLTSGRVFSQQVIKLKNGQKYSANIIYRTRDTLVYRLLSKPGVENFVLMKDVDEITNLNPVHRILWDTLPAEKKEELYLKNKELKSIGVGFQICGALVTGVGLVLIIPAALKDFNHVTESPGWVKEQLTGGVIICAVGIAGLLTGTILSTTGKSRMKKYSIEHHKFSFDIRYTPACRGFSLVYRF